APEPDPCGSSGPGLGDALLASGRPGPARRSGRPARGRLRGRGEVEGRLRAVARDDTFRGHALAGRDAAAVLDAPSGAPGARGVQPARAAGPPRCLTPRPR